MFAFSLSLPLGVISLGCRGGLWWEVASSPPQGPCLTWCPPLWDDDPHWSDPHMPLLGTRSAAFSALPGGSWCCTCRVCCSRAAPVSRAESWGNGPGVSAWKSAPEITTWKAAPHLNLYAKHPFSFCVFFFFLFVCLLVFGFFLGCFVCFFFLDSPCSYHTAVETLVSLPFCGSPKPQGYKGFVALCVSKPPGWNTKVLRFQPQPVRLWGALWVSSHGLYLLPDCGCGAMGAPEHQPGCGAASWELALRAGKLEATDCRSPWQGIYWLPPFPPPLTGKVWYKWVAMQNCVQKDSIRWGKGRAKHLAEFRLFCAFPSTIKLTQLSLCVLVLVEG